MSPAGAMRILIAHEALAGAGGVESYLASVIPALLSQGHAVGYLHFDPRQQPGPTRLEFSDVPSFGVTDDGLERSIAAVAAWGPDVCFSHNMGALDVDEALVARWPTIKMMHGYFGTCISGHKAHAFPSIVPCTREFGAPCLTLFFPRHCGQLRPFKMATQFKWNWRQRRLFDRYAGVVVASVHMEAEYLRHGVPRARLLTAPLFPTSAPASTPRVAPSQPTVLFAGRMTELKGPRVLVSAIARASALLGRPVHLVLAGEGPERERLRSLSMSLGVHATFPGWVTGDERIALMRLATIIAVPSLWPEPFGLVGLEAAVHGVPSVAFDVGGISEWLRDGINGRLVTERGSAPALGTAIAELLGDPATLASMERGALTVSAEMSLDVHLAHLERAFRAAISQAVRA
ncbi:MAG TPA: glycosyltransferase family 4 protein [Vicinamibacterales bacterium]|nr:glycosyltransferase family 4 protein [Vicinamibacterales bacterium]